MLELPQRHSLVNQTAAALRKGIRGGEWQSVLPGERTLAAKLQVSRPTVRAAIALLEREGLLKGQRGIGRRIQAEPVEPAPVPRDRVGVITSKPIHQMPPVTLFYLNELRNHLQEAGFRLEIFADPALEEAKPERALDKITRQPDVACWILSAPTAAAQTWCAERALPVLVAGTVETGLPLPFIDLDYQAVCRHAAGVLLRHGHRRIALFLAGAHLAASRLSLEGLRAGVEIGSRDDAAVVLVEHDGTPRGICQKLDQLLARAEPPTALVVSRPLHVLTTLTHLARRGVGVPGNLSIISRDNDSWLDYLTPPVSRYTFRRRAFAERLSRLAVQLAVDGSIPPAPHWHMPDYDPGETAGPVPAR